MLKGRLIVDAVPMTGIHSVLEDVDGDVVKVRHAVCTQLGLHLQGLPPLIYKLAAFHPAVTSPRAKLGRGLKHGRCHDDC